MHFNRVSCDTISCQASIRSMLASAILANMVFCMKPRIWPLRHRSTLLDYLYRDLEVIIIASEKRPGSNETSSDIFSTTL